MASSQEKKISSEDNIAVGWSISVTGDSISDDLCQLGAYVPNKSFNQYIMPSAIPNMYIEQNYGLKVNTFKRCRILRHIATNAPLITKTEQVTIKNFLKWLQLLKAETSKDLILVYHDIEDKIQLKLMEVMKRNNLYDEFKNLVKGFCNICFISKFDESSQIKLFSLQELAKVLLDIDDNMHSAFERAKSTYNILQQIVVNKDIINRRQIPTDLIEINQDIRKICKDIMKKLKARNRNPEFKLSKLLGVYSNTFAEQEKELIEAQNIVDVEKEFDPIFRDYILYSDSTREQAIRLRNKLISFSIKYSDIKLIWETNGRYGLENYFQLLQMPKHEYDEMINIFDSHFDPNKIELIDQIKKSHKAQAVAYKRKLIHRSKCKSSKVRPVRRNENGEWDVIPSNYYTEETVTYNEDSNWIVNDEIVPAFEENVRISPSNHYSNVIYPYSNTPVLINYENNLPSTSSQYVHDEFKFSIDRNQSYFNLQNAQAPVIYETNPNPYYINPYDQPGTALNFGYSPGMYSTPTYLPKPLNANAREFIMKTNTGNQSAETIVSKSKYGKNTIPKVSKITKYGTSFSKSSGDSNTTFTVYPTSTTANTMFTNASIKYELIGNVKNVNRLENTCAASSQGILPKLENVKKDHESKNKETKTSTQQTSENKIEFWNSIFSDDINTAPLNLNENWNAAKVPTLKDISFKIESTVPESRKKFDTGYSGVGQDYKNEYWSLFSDNLDTQPSTSGLNISATWPPLNNDNQVKPIIAASSKVSDEYNTDNLKSIFPYTLNSEHILGSLIPNRNLTPRTEDLNLDDIEMDEPMSENQNKSISETKKSDS